MQAAGARLRGLFGEELGLLLGLALLLSLCQLAGPLAGPCQLASPLAGPCQLAGPLAGPMVGPLVRPLVRPLHTWKGMQGAARRGRVPAASIHHAAKYPSAAAGLAWLQAHRTISLGARACMCACVRALLAGERRSQAGWPRVT